MYCSVCLEFKEVKEEDCAVDAGRLWRKRRKMEGSDDLRQSKLGVGASDGRAYDWRLRVRGSSKAGPLGRELLRHQKCRRTAKHAIYTNGLGPGLLTQSKKSLQ